MTTPPWFVEVVHLTNRDKQQEVLELFEDVTGLTASGISSGGQHFVVLGCVDRLMKSAAEVLIADIDRGAVYDSYISGSRPRSHTMPARASGTAWLN